MWRSSVLVGWMTLTGVLSLTAESDSATVARDRADDVTTLVEDLDRAFVAGLDPEQRRALRPASDEEFARRAWLEIAGRIPTVAELRAFLESDEPDKRDALIDALLDSPGHDSRTFAFWADLLRVRSRLNTFVPGAPYIHWLKESISSGKHYDDMVRELLTAEGPAQERGNGATGYWLRDRGMPEDAMANTLRAFLGTRIECAQCHDHPFDVWTRKQFYEMTAFTGGMEYRAPLRDAPNAQVLRELNRELRASGDQNGARALQRLLRPSLAGVYGSGSGLVRLPDDYQYDDAAPEQWIEARAIFGEPVDLDVAPPAERRRRPRRARGERAERVAEVLDARRARSVDSRAAFADWLTSPENPFFTRSIANRMWQRALGRGLIEPVDDLDLDSQASNPELLARLEELMVAVDYDLDAFLAVAYRTRAWQAAAVAPEDAGESGELPAGPLVRRMSAEQTWDSLLTLMVRDVDATLDEDGDEQAELVYATYESLSSSSVEELRERAERTRMRMNDQDEFRRMRAEERREGRAERRERARDNRGLMRELDRARRSGDTAAARRARESLAEVGVLVPRTQRERELVRASELRVPAPDGHFLRQFGQSDHEQIDGAHTEASVPQALALLNGAVETYLVQDSGAFLNRELRGLTEPDARLEYLFLAVVGRMPTARERDLWRPDLEADLDTATRDLLWVLVNSHEFLFVR